MSHRKKILKGVGCVALALAAAGLTALSQLEWLATYAITPQVSFDLEAPPPPPDYSRPGSWSALPERGDLADRAPTGMQAIDPQQASVDVFYVHPTSYVGRRWNAPTDDPALNDATDRVATGIQAPAFNGCCAVYAPRYRQANGTVFTQPTPEGDRALALAYSDVRRAFDAFNSRRGADRPFILAAHSQGSVMAERLLYEVISDTPLRNQLVAAYLIGGGITVTHLLAGAPDVPLCGAPDDLHCLIAWNARSPGYVPSKYDLHAAEAHDWVCTNPLSWWQDGKAVSRDSNLGAVFLETEAHTAQVRFADARCVDGALVVSHLGPAPRDIPSRVLDHVMGRGNYHPLEYQIFFMNLWQNATLRASAATASRPE